MAAGVGWSRDSTGQSADGSRRTAGDLNFRRLEVGDRRGRRPALTRRPRDRPVPPAAGSAFRSLRRRRPSAPLPDGTQLAPIRRRLIRSRDQSVNKPKTNTRRRPVRPPASIKRRRSAGSEQRHPHGHQSAAGPPIT